MIVVMTSIPKKNYLGMAVEQFLHYYPKDSKLSSYIMASTYFDSDRQ